MATTEQSVTRPYTGAEYLEHQGQPDHLLPRRAGQGRHHASGVPQQRPLDRPALRRPARPDQRDVLTAPTDTGNGGFTHPFFRVPKPPRTWSPPATPSRRWQRLVYGWMGRSPDYKASFLGTLGANGEYYGDVPGQRRALVPESQEQVPLWNHAIVHPPVDRHLPVDETDDVCMHVEKETDNGVVVSRGQGRRHGIGAHPLQLHRPLRPRAAAPSRSTRIVCVAPMDSPGVKLLCRNSYELQAAAVGSPFDYPLSSRLDENDSILVFDKVLDPVGERLPLRRHGEGRQLLPGHRVHPPVHVPRSRPALRQGGLHLRRAVQGAPAPPGRAASGACRPSSAR